jgi:hypothetical protein
VLGEELVVGFCRFLRGEMSSPNHAQESSWHEGMTDLEVERTLKSPFAEETDAPSKIHQTSPAHRDSFDPVQRKTPQLEELLICLADELQCRQGAFRMMLQRLDRYRDGTISQKDLQLALTDFDLSLGSEDLTHILDHFDVDRTGWIDWENLYHVLFIPHGGGSTDAPFVQHAELVASSLGASTVKSGRKLNGKPPSLTPPPPPPDDSQLKRPQRRASTSAVATHPGHLRNEASIDSSTRSVHRSRESPAKGWRFNTVRHSATVEGSPMHRTWLEKQSLRHSLPVTPSIAGRAATPDAEQYTIQDKTRN